MSSFSTLIRPFNGSNLHLKDVIWKHNYYPEGNDRQDRRWVYSLRIYSQPAILWVKSTSEWVACSWRNSNVGRLLSSKNLYLSIFIQWLLYSFWRQVFVNFIDYWRQSKSSIDNLVISSLNLAHFLYRLAPKNLFYSLTRF